MKKFNVSPTQIVVAVIGGGLLYLISTGLVNYPSISGFAFLAIVAYLTTVLLYVTARPSNDEVVQKLETTAALAKGICPFCRSNHVGSYTVNVGYRRRQYSNFRYMVFWIEWSHKMLEPHMRIPICDDCRTNYLKACSKKILPKGIRNPSRAVLKRKPGYRRGLVFPFETWNIKSVLDE